MTGPPCTRDQRQIEQKSAFYPAGLPISHVSTGPTTRKFFFPLQLIPVGRLMISGTAHFNLEPTDIPTNE